MAFNINPGKQQFIATASQTVFTFNFAIFADTDIKVYKTLAGALSDDTNDVLTLTADYSVSINGTLGGTVTLSSGAGVNDIITIARALPISRTTDYVTNGDLYADTLDLDQDYQTYLVLDQQVRWERSLVLPESYDGDVFTMPAPDALKMFRWDITGSFIENIDPSNILDTTNGIIVDTVADLATIDTALHQTAIVKDLNRGGTFIWSSTGTANGGTVFAGATGFWNRQYDGAVNVKWFGAKGDGVTDDTIAFELIQQVTEAVSLNNGIYLLYPTTRIVLKCSELIGENAVIKLASNINFSLLELENAHKVSKIVFEGNNKYCCDNNYDHFILSVTSPIVTVSECVFKNISGVQDRWQYALGIRWNTKSIVSNCHFEEIHTPTNSTNTAGFCGGIFIASDPLNTTNLIQSAHTVENCTFAQIYTTANTSFEVYPDSDGIRNFIYNYSLLSAALQDVVSSTTITVRGCSFIDVRKSGTKLNNCIASVENCRFNILDAGTQTLIYSAFRYQSGPFFSVRDCYVSGELIAQACLLAGTKNIADNIYFSTTYVDAQAVFIGNDDIVEDCSIDRVYVDSDSKLLRIKLSNTVNVSSCVMAIDTAKAVDIVEDVSTLNIDRCILKGKFVLYSVSKTISNLNIVNSSGSNTTTGTVFGNFPITNLLLSGVSWVNTNGSVVSLNVANATIVNSDFTISGTVATRAFNFSGATMLTWSNSKITDTSNKDAGIYSTASENRIDGIVSNVVCTNAQLLLIPVGATSTNTVRNAIFTGGQAHLLELQKCNKVQVSNITSEVASGDIELWSNVASTALVSNFSGTIAATPIIKTNYTVTEVGIASL